MPRRGGGGRRSGGGGGLFGSRKPAAKSGGFFSSRKKAAPTPARRPSAAPQARAAPSAPATGGGGMMSGIGSTIVQGMAFGTGSAIAHRAVGAVANSFGGSGETENKAPESAGAESGAAAWEGDKKAPEKVDCSGFMSALNQCLTKNPGEIAMCQQPMDMLRDCKFQQEQASTGGFSSGF